MHEEHGIVESLVQEIFTWVRSHGTYIPRDYQTIGGAWTVDTWQLGDIKVQLMDEGYTQCVITDSLNVVKAYGQPPMWRAGSIADLRIIHATIKETI